ncbi:zinc finger protein [Macleaya cordata]|uniref:Zinc finger protein n=1 Tax=Macleaya cordata TaxID=56857 RepID=A0A200QZH6_MACCD|nr:zinc finger protein [Macleaya cordata]
MAIPQHQLQQQQQQATQFRNLSTVDNQMSAPITFFNPCNFADQSYPQYIPPFHVVGLAPGPVPVPDAFDGGDLRWSNGSEITKKRLKEQDFLENNNNNNNSQISSVDFLQSRSVSTGLGLSLDDRRLASSGESPVFSLFNDEIDRELQRQDAEIDRFVKVQGERLRQAILEKVQANQLQTISLTEEKVLQKLRERDTEVESINKKNMELEEQMKQLVVEAGAWQHRAKCNENMITTLKFNIRQVLVQNRESKEGCGDSEVDDTASCCNSGAIDFHLIGKENKDLKDSMTCKVCKVNQLCMLLLPCRHLCLCKDCESKLGFCPLCQSSKLIGMEIFM